MYIYIEDFFKNVTHICKFNKIKRDNPYDFEHYVNVLIVNYSSKLRVNFSIMFFIKGKYIDFILANQVFSTLII